MFLTSPSFEYKRPFGNRTVEGQVWRGVEIFWEVGGFIARVRLRDDPEGHERTLMLSRDADVVHLVDGPLRADLKSLTFLRMTRDGRPTHFVAEDVSEIHRGTDAGVGGKVIVFRSSSGSTFRVDRGVSDASSVVNLRLVARIVDSPDRASSTGRSPR
jgi:hypothetical protein